MASMLIHMCVSKEIDKKLNIKDKKMYMLGSIAPDIAKLINIKREISHFIFHDDIIDIDYFLNKYKSVMKNPFMLGYYVHLYTDILWEKYFLDNIVLKKSIRLLDGTFIENNDENYKKLIYNDYTNLNERLIKKYEINMDDYFKDYKLPNIVMDEIPIEKLDIVVKYNEKIIENTKSSKSYTFNIDNVIPFINISRNLILGEIKRLNLY